MHNDGKDVSKHLTSLMKFFAKNGTNLKLLANSVFLQCYALGNPESFMIFSKVNKVFITN